jgi:FlaA1/EpsC-like NDP-sugar epimerase
MRNRYVLLADLPAIALAASGAFLLRFDWWFYRDRAEFSAFLIAALLIKPVVFYALGMYRRYWRYASTGDLMALALAVAASSAAMTVFVVLALFAGQLEAFSRSVVVLDFLLTLVFAGGVRFAVRVIAESLREPRGAGGVLVTPRQGARRRTLVVGAGDAGAMVVREMQRNPQLGMQPVGFLDDDPAKRSKEIYGVTVLGDVASLGRVARSARADEVVIAMPTAAGPAVREAVEACQALGLQSRTIPGVFELLDGKVSVNRLRHVEITDLLRRSQVAAREDSSGYVTGRTVLVTGAGGSIGMELCRQVAHRRPRRLVLLGHGENSLYEAAGRLREMYPQVEMPIALVDIRDRRRLKRLFRRYEPEVVLHAAAHKHVPLLEENFEEAISNNVVGTRNLVDAALEAGTERLVAISTDKAVSPTGIMGASKRMAGLIVRDAARRSGRAFVVVRFGNVLGSRGSVVPLFKQQIERGGPVTVTHPDMTRFFMTIAEAVHLVLQAGGIGKGGELFVLDMGPPVRIMDLARDLIHLSGFTTEQVPIAITGMRAGEKLEESLWEDGAQLAGTAHPDVRRVTEHPEYAGDLDAAVETLYQAARAGNRAGVEAVLADCIPTFAPSRPAVPRPVPRVVRRASSS